MDCGESGIAWSALGAVVTDARPFKIIML